MPSRSRSRLLLSIAVLLVGCSLTLAACGSAANPLAVQLGTVAVVTPSADPPFPFDPSPSRSFF